MSDCPDGFEPIELTPITIESSDCSHGEYVGETMDEYGPDAHSCIRMPMVSNKNK